MFLLKQNIQFRFLRKDFILHIQEPLQSKLKLCEEDQVEGIHLKTAPFALNQNANVQATK